MSDSVTVIAIGETTFPFHSFDEMGPVLEDAIAGNVSVETTTERDRLLDLEGVDVVVDYLTDSDLTADQQASLLGFVRDGGGYVGVHCAADLTSVATADGMSQRDEPIPELRELIGGHFVTHPEQQEFAVEIVDREHQITQGLGTFEVFDEPYQLEVDEDVHVLARMNRGDDPDGMPVAWVKTYGEGRVFYLSLGHTTEALDHPSVSALLTSGIKWAAGTVAMN